MVPSMGITNNNNFLSTTDTSDTNDPLEKIIDKYKNHPSITCIIKHMTNSELSFTFQPVTKNQISNLIKLLNDKKAIQSTDIPNTGVVLVPCSRMEVRPYSYFQWCGYF